MLKFAFYENADDIRYCPICGEKLIGSFRCMFNSYVQKRFSRLPNNNRPCKKFESPFAKIHKPIKPTIMNGIPVYKPNSRMFTRQKSKIENYFKDFSVDVAPGFQCVCCGYVSSNVAQAIKQNANKKPIY